MAESIDWDAAGDETAAAFLAVCRQAKDPDEALRQSTSSSTKLLPAGRAAEYLAPRRCPRSRSRSPATRTVAVPEHPPGDQHTATSLTQADIACAG